MSKIALVMFKSDGSRRDFPLGKDRVIIGRKVNCDLRIPLTSVSRQHCEITLDQGRVTVKDLGSSNGTYHNSVRVQEAHLSAGDELVIGPVVFTLVVDGQPADIKPVKTIVSSDGGALHASVVRSGGSSVGGSSSSAEVSAEDLELPDMITAGEGMTPTVELDDPIAALESMADNDDDASDEFDDIDFFDIDEDDDRA